MFQLMMLSDAQFDGTDAFTAPAPGTLNMTPGGHVPDNMRHASWNDGDVLADSPQGGISYINQAVGGVASSRPDARVFARSGIRPTQHLTIRGIFVGGLDAFANRAQGIVGLSGRQRLAERVALMRSVVLADQGAVAEAFVGSDR